VWAKSPFATSDTRNCAGHERAPRHAWAADERETARVPKTKPCQAPVLPQ
jgi:hypothetical protein